MNCTNTVHHRKSTKHQVYCSRYHEDSQHYFSEDLLKTIDNEGRFRIVETKNPVGYTGSWEKEIDITDKNASLFFKSNRILKFRIIQEPFI